MLKDWLNNVDEDMKKKFFYGFLAIMSLIAIYTFTRAYFYQKQINEVSIVVERQVGQYKLTRLNGPAPFTIDMIDLQTNQVLKDVFISIDCPKYEKNSIGTVLSMYKVSNMNARSGEKFYTYEGAYDTLCTNKIKKQQ